MAGKVVPAPPATPFEYELVEDDDHLRTVVASSNQSTFWIDPANLKLRHRIGRGLFGDVYLATHHRSTEDYDEYHEVAVKILHQVSKDYVRVLLHKFESLLSKCQGMEGVCLLHGVSIINGKLCVIMKFYEGSVADKMAGRKGGKLLLPDVLRYGIKLAQGISELHAQGIIVLNLKCSNILLAENDEVVVGDIGIPFLLVGIPLLSSDMSRRIGTPNYMAPEQWQPEVRGPLSYETDSWGFGCSILEMLTGVQPWCGKSVDEIYNSVVRKQEKPHLPEGLPPLVENVLFGCFDYDIRNRPLMTDIIRVFKSSQNAVYSDGGWTGLGSITISERSNDAFTEWFLSKDHLQVGDTVRSRKLPNSHKPDNMDVPEGMVVGLEQDSDRHGFVLVRVHGIHDPLRVPASSLERVSFGFAAGDWVRLKEEDKKHSQVGVLHSISRDGEVFVAYIGAENLWKGNPSELQMAESFFVGQFVRLKAKVLNPRFEWPRKRGGAWATGRICRILANGCLVVTFPGRLAFGEEYSSFLSDPAEVEAVSFDTCRGVVKKYQHLEDFHWAVRPLLMALGLFTAIKVGFFVGKKVGRSKVKKRNINAVQFDGQQMNGQTAGNSNVNNPAWLPPSVANILGVSPGAAR